MTGKKSGATLLLVNSPMTFKAKLKDWPKVNLEGSTPDNDYKTVRKLWEKWTDTLGKLDKRNRYLLGAVAEAEDKGDSTAKQAIQLEINTLKNKTEEIKATRMQEQKDYIYSHLNSTYIPDLIYKMQRLIPLAERLDMYRKLSDKAKKSFIIVIKKFYAATQNRLSFICD